MRSLALKYLSWERRSKGISSIGIRLDTGLAYYGRGSCSLRFLTRFSLNYLESARRVIRYSKKLLYIEKLCKGEGFLAFLVFRFNAWRHLAYQQLTTLVNALQKRHSMRNSA